MCRTAPPPRAPSCRPTWCAKAFEVTKRSNQLTLAVNLLSPDGRYDDLFISNYASIHVADALKRVPASAMC